MKTVYAALLPLIPADDVAARAWDLCCEWAAPGHQVGDADVSEAAVLPNERVRFTSLVHGIRTVRHLDRYQQATNDLPTGWRTHAWVCDDGVRPWVTIRSGPETQDGYVTNLRFDAFRPRIVGDILDEIGAVQDGRRLEAKALNMGQGDLEGFLALLEDDRRHLPIIGISLPPGGAHRPLLPPHQVAARLAGNAHVVVLDRTLSWNLTERIGKALSVFNGAVRIWWPTLRRADDPQRHQILMPDVVESNPDGAVRFLQSRVWRAAVDGIPAPRIEARLRTAIASDRTKARVAELRHRQADYDELLEELERQLDSNVMLREELDEALAHVEELQTDLAAAATGLDDVNDDQLPEVDSVRHAVETAASEATGGIVYLPSAYDSADRSEYPNPQQVLADLRCLNRVAARWLADDLPGGFDAAFDDEPVMYRPGIGNTAMTKYKADYQIQYAGQTVLMGPHLRRGRGAPRRILRIYWFVDSVARQLVVGHVGEKLRDQSNP